MNLEDRIVRLRERRTHPKSGRNSGSQVTLYVRVSTSDQKPDLQYDGLRSYAARADLEIVRDYCDAAVSGRREGRPQLNALITTARNRETDCVLVWKFDRFASSTRHLLAALEEFNYLGIRFVSVQNQIDTNSPMGRAMFTIIGAMAELGSSLISKRVTADMKAAEARGRHLGRPPVTPHIASEIEALAAATDFSAQQIQRDRRESQPGRGRENHQARPRRLAARPVTTFYMYLEPTPGYFARRFGAIRFLGG